VHTEQQELRRPVSSPGSVVSNWSSSSARLTWRAGFAASGGVSVAAPRGLARGDRYQAVAPPPIASSLGMRTHQNAATEVAFFYHAM
jgi:hypothetical protein